MKSQPWLYSRWIDSIFILLPPIIVLLVILLFQSYFVQVNEVNIIAWVILVMCIDVAHVYSTIYRTYFDKAYLNGQGKILLIIIPIACWFTGMIIYSLGDMLFWRCMAYLAVFHFIRQQYGFMRLYSRNDEIQKFDTVVIYTLTIYPVIYWHLKGPFHFNWFVEGDFIQFQSELLHTIAAIIYVGICLAYIFKECYIFYRHNWINIPKNMLMIGTGLSWYFGIVYFNNDLIFTLLNIVSHGIPYMALVWIYGRKKYQKISAATWVSRLFSSKVGWLLFIGSLIVFAYLEEGLWDAMIWREHGSVFDFFYVFNPIETEVWLTVLVPLLSVPQLSHYLIDGFIWRLKDDHSNWQEIVFGNWKKS